MNQNLAELEAELNAVPGYAEQFRAVFASKATKDAIAKSLAAFQRSLVTGPAPLDRYLAGDKDALWPSAQRGLELFLGDAGCVRCHSGPLLSDGKYYRLGVSVEDLGRGAIDGNDDEHGKFRTPSLRNVAQTAPYMHDGSLKTLDEVVTYYYRGVSAVKIDGRDLDIKPLLGQSFSEIPDLVAFLESLSGEIPRITPPKLP
jgi:cytochrome c peroxidase